MVRFPRTNARTLGLAVIEADGSVRPMLLSPHLGKHQRRGIDEILNSDAAIAFRRGLDVREDATCRRCVCTFISDDERGPGSRRFELARDPPPVSKLVRSLCEPWMRYRRAMLRPRLSRAVIEQVRGRDFVVWPGVFNPVIFRTGRFLAEFVDAHRRSTCNQPQTVRSMSGRDAEFSPCSPLHGATR